MNPVEHEPAMSAECLIAELQAEADAEHVRTRQKLVAEGMPVREIEAVMRHAASMHAEYIACAERRLGLAPAVVVH